MDKKFIRIKNVRIRLNSISGYDTFQYHSDKQEKLIYEIDIYLKGREKTISIGFDKLEDRDEAINFLDQLFCSTSAFEESNNQKD
jgi:hypothetical protein